RRRLMAQEGLVNRPLVRAWLWWALVWLTVFPIVGVLVSIKFHNPEFLGSTSWLTFGRMRPVHVNGVIFGAFSTTFLGLLYYYVPMWYTVAALVWTLMNLILGNVVLQYANKVTGVNSTALHGLYIHYIVGLWLTPAGLAMIYYFLPPSTKNALYSHRLSLLGFWSLAFFYPFVGIHHYMYSPIPHWNQTIAVVTSMLLIIPVWAVTVN